MTEQIMWLGVYQDSNGDFRVKINGDSITNDEYLIDEQNLKYLFNESGRLLRESKPSHDD